MAKRLCTTHVSAEIVAPILACRLIALDKCPGVRPIGIGDIERRIIAMCCRLKKGIYKKQQVQSSYVQVKLLEWKQPYMPYMTHLSMRTLKQSY